MAEPPTIRSGNLHGVLEPEEAHLQSVNTPGNHPQTDLRTNEIDALSIEATELERIKSNYRRVTTSRGRESGVRSIEPQTTIDRLIYSVSKFWRLQVSVIVAHENCRDHLGMEQVISLPEAILL